MGSYTGNTSTVSGTPNVYRYSHMTPDIESPATETFDNIQCQNQGIIRYEAQIIGSMNGSTANGVNFFIDGTQYQGQMIYTSFSTAYFTYGKSWEYGSSGTTGYLVSLDWLITGLDANSLHTLSFIYTSPSTLYSYEVTLTGY